MKTTHSWKPLSINMHNRHRCGNCKTCYNNTILITYVIIFRLCSGFTVNAKISAAMKHLPTYIKHIINADIWIIFTFMCVYIYHQCASIESQIVSQFSVFNTCNQPTCSCLTAGREVLRPQSLPWLVGILKNLHWQGINAERFFRCSCSSSMGISLLHQLIVNFKSSVLIIKMWRHILG